MASVQLDAVVLALATNLADLVVLDVTSLKDTDDPNGEVRGYASGRQRNITRPGGRRVVSFTGDVVQDRDTLDKLQSWSRHLVLLRDPRGRKVYGRLSGVDVTENIAVDVAEISATVTQVTVSELV